MILANDTCKYNGNVHRHTHRHTHTHMDIM